MYSKINITLAGIFCLFFLSFCAQSDDQASVRQADTETAAEIPSAAASEIQVDDLRARPAGEGSMSAAYFTITNHTSAADTLLSISSDAAQLLEIHESFEGEDGMMGMREIEGLEIPAGSVVHLEPGGYHVMLMRLNEDLEAGQTFEMTLHFARNGDETVEVPVRPM